MWYEICIPGAIIITATSMPALLCPLWNKFWLGNAYNRWTEDSYVEHFWHRDTHLTGNPYRPHTIDDLPDKPADKKE